MNIIKFKLRTTLLTISILLWAASACSGTSPEPTPSIITPSITPTVGLTATPEGYQETLEADFQLQRTQTASMANWMYDQAMMGNGKIRPGLSMPQQDHIGVLPYHYVSGNIYVVGYTGPFSIPLNLRAGGPEHTQLILTDYYFMVELEFTSACGKTPLGIFIRENTESYTLFAIRCTNEYSFTEVIKDSDEELYQWQSTNLVDKDTNILEVVAYQDMVLCYLNGQLVGELTGINQEGQFGVHMGIPIEEEAAMFRFLQYELRTFFAETEDS
jgi:hypothetical protein